MKTGPKETGWKCVVWIDLGRYKNKWQSVLKMTVKSYSVKCGEFLD